ncbi:MAG: LysE family transporter [Pseudomonadota bacterium]
MDLAAYWPSLLSVFGASLIAFLSPGPNFVGIVSAAVASRAHGFAVALGCSIGTAFWSLMAVTGTTALLALNPRVALAMQILGGSYLMFLGFKSLRSSFAPSGPVLMTTGLAQSLWESFRKGLFIQVTNPKTALFWLSMVSVVILPKTPVLVCIILIAGTTCIALGWHSVLAVAFSHPRVSAGYVRRRKYISFAFGFAFLALGARLALGALHGLV